MRKLLTATLLAVLFSASAYAQTVVKATITSYGQSPRDVARSTADIFDRPYNGLLNVGIGTKMYLKASAVRYRTTTNTSGVTSVSRADTSLVNPVWTLSARPTGSSAVMGATKDTIVSNVTYQVIAFVPDVAGTYKVKLETYGTFVEISINSGSYVGINATFSEGGCALCHSDKKADWLTTGHHDGLDEGLNGEKGANFGKNCVSCHSTGYDANPAAINGGFDDNGFLFPSHVGPGVADSIRAANPVSMKLANIQCESCHGPGSAHKGDMTDNKMATSLKSDVCSYCHDSGTHHVYPDQWDNSRHGAGTSWNSTSEVPRSARTDCAYCHGTAGFKLALEIGSPVYPNKFTSPDTSSFLANAGPLGCVTCHNPHEKENEHQVRTTADVRLADGSMVTGGGLGKLCMNCHRSRNPRTIYGKAPIAGFGVHDAAQAEMFSTLHVPTFGKTLPTSPHYTAVEDLCITCHMAEGYTDSTRVGGHSFAMNYTNPVTNKTVYNVKACEKCHGYIGESFEEKKYYYMGKADHDGNGKAEGVQIEVDSLKVKLLRLLPRTSATATTPNMNIAGRTYSQAESDAGWNWYIVDRDNSRGIHNPAFTVALLKASIEAVQTSSAKGQIASIEDVPNDQGKQAFVIWNRCLDDGSAADPVASYTIKRLDKAPSGDVWTGVGEHTADGSDRYSLVVPTLFDATPSRSDTTLFKFVAKFASGKIYESNIAKGITIDNLVPTAPGGLMVQQPVDRGIKLLWDEPVDKDFSYFAVYRSLAPNFVPSATNRITTLVGEVVEGKVSFIDTFVFDGKTYYYKISAFDFSENESPFSDELKVEASLSVEDPDTQALPKELVLSQNHPNPFNPSTTISFGLPRDEQITVNIYDVSGAFVRSLAKGRFSAGYHSLTWDARNNSGHTVSTGTYFYRLETTSKVITKKATLLK